MEPFRRLEALACALPLSGIDTDQLIPARFMSRSRAEGYGGYLMHDLRFDETGRPRPDFPLNDPERAGARILVARRNFGGGSSREAAAYALVDYGIRCVIAPSFGDIFSANGVNNGLLPARADEQAVERLIAALGSGTRTITIDLDDRTIRAGADGLAATFEIDPVFRTKLLNGWDDLDLTMNHCAEIASFAEADRERRPWMAPAATNVAGTTPRRVADQAPSAGQVRTTY